MKETLDQLLEAANASFGLAIITDNPTRLRVAFHQRLTEHRKNHPEAYKNLLFLTGRSPRELYVVNRQTANVARGEQEPSGDDPEADARLAVHDLSSDGSGEQADPSADREPSTPSGENPQ